MKTRLLKSRLSKAGFIRLHRRGKGSHSIWRHEKYKLTVIQSGKDNKDALPYQVKAVRLALKKVSHLK